MNPNNNSNNPRTAIAGDRDDDRHSRAHARTNAQTHARTPAASRLTLTDGARGTAEQVSAIIIRFVTNRRGTTSLSPGRTPIVAAVVGSAGVRNLVSVKMHLRRVTRPIPRGHCTAR